MLGLLLLALVVLVLWRSGRGLGRSHEPMTVACRPRTVDNPFGSPLIYAGDDALEACPMASTDAEFALYRDNLLIDSRDLFYKRTGFAQFGVLPSTTFPSVVRPEAFYPIKPGCKSANRKCTAAKNHYWR